MDEILDFLKKNPTYFIASTDENGDPQVRPFGTILKYEDALYIQTGKVKNCYKQMIAHPRIALSGMSKEGTWIRLEADIVEDDSVEVNSAMLDDYPSLKGPYAAGDGNCTCFRLENISATLYSFTADPKVLA